MKYKLSDKLNALLTDTVISQYKETVEKGIIQSFEESDFLLAKSFFVDGKRAVHGFDFDVTIKRSDLVEIEQLKPYVWYERAKFDGNPNQWMLFERTINDNGWEYFYFYEESGGDELLHQLCHNTTHFMYIEKPNK